MEITGNLVEITEVQKGTSARGDWTKHGFVIETKDAYPKKVFISFWNNKIDLNQFNIGDTITVSINIESREFNGKWYTDVTAWKVSKQGQPQEQTPPNSEVPLPPPPPEIENMEDDDNLPF